jgi:hypothetical protein
MSSIASQSKDPLCNDDNRKSDYGTDASSSNNDDEEQDLEKHIKQVWGSSPAYSHHWLRPVADFLVSSTALPQLVMVSIFTDCDLHISCTFSFFGKNIPHTLTFPIMIVGLSSLVPVGCRLLLAIITPQALSRCFCHHDFGWPGTECECFRVFSAFDLELPRKCS